MSAEHDVDRVVRDAFFAKKKKGVLVDVGAARPDFLSISASYRELGWKIVSVEPNPEFCAMHRALGYEILEYAASDTESDDTNFFVVDSKGADYMGGPVSYESYSSLGIRGEYADMREGVKDRTSVKTIPVKVRKLDTILAEHEPGIGEIDILTIDVEGWELNVMRGLSIDRYKPKVVIMENLFNKTEYINFMKERGYKLWRTLEPNEIYVRNELLTEQRD
jgi:FkbM family methyltransferase